MDYNFNVGDKVWCRVKGEYSVTDYHVPCVVVRTYNSGMMEVSLLKYYDSGCHTAMYNAAFHYPVRSCYFERIKYDAKNSFTTSFESFEKLPSGYDYEITRDKATGEYILHTSKRFSKNAWVEETLSDFVKHKSLFVHEASNGYIIVFGMFEGKAVSGVSKCNWSDDFDRRFGTAIAYCRCIGKEIPTEVFKD